MTTENGKPAMMADETPSDENFDAWWTEWYLNQYKDGDSSFIRLIAKRAWWNARYRYESPQPARPITALDEAISLTATHVCHSVAFIEGMRAYAAGEYSGVNPYAANPKTRCCSAEWLDGYTSARDLEALIMSPNKYRCIKCGCLWKVHADDTSSLYDGDQRSCKECEASPIRGGVIEPHALGLQHGCAFNEGFRAFHAGLAYESNPYKNPNYSATAWSRGYEEAEK